MASVPKRARLVTNILILPDGRFRRFYRDDSSHVKITRIFVNTPRYANDVIGVPSHRYEATMNDDLIGDDIVIIRRLPKSPRFAHIPVYVLRKP